MELLFLLAFFGFFAFVFWSAFTRKGRGRQFGGEFIWSSEPYVIGEQKVGKQVLIIHQVASTKASAEHAVGLEFRFTHPLAFSVIPIKLTSDQAREFARDLERAAG